MFNTIEKVVRLHKSAQKYFKAHYNSVDDISCAQNVSQSQNKFKSHKFPSKYIRGSFNSHHNQG